MSANRQRIVYGIWKLKAKLKLFITYSKVRHIKRRRGQAEAETETETASEINRDSRQRDRLTDARHSG